MNVVNKFNKHLFLIKKPLLGPEHITSSYYAHKGTRREKKGYYDCFRIARDDERNREHNLRFSKHGYIGG